jgi:putative lipoic acid-binding regulatory protein
VKTAKFKELLDKHYNWPEEYTFKFIVPKAQESFVDERLKDFQVMKKPSKKGNYISYTFKAQMSSANQVVVLYENVLEIKGVIAL